ncbi:MAG: hypothetical protein JW807_05960 [Spirochaetes bacterium]|nr:hypothetical protein [Spirochaetota bacterium]
MDIFSIILLVVVAFVIAAFILMRVFRKPALEDIGLHYGEKVLHDEDDCVIEAYGAGGAETLRDIFVRVTDRRIILGQRTSGRTAKHALRYIVYYGDMSGVRFSRRQEKQDYVIMKADPQKLAVTDDGLFLIEALSGQGPEVPGRLHLKSPHIDSYRDLFRM